MDRHVDVPAVAGHRLVDRVVDDLVDQVVQAARRSCRRCTCRGAAGPPRSPRGPGCWPRCSPPRPRPGRPSPLAEGIAVRQSRPPRLRFRRSCSNPSRVHLGQVMQCRADRGTVGPARRGRRSGSSTVGGRVASQPQSSDGDPARSHVVSSPARVPSGRRRVGAFGLGLAVAVAAVGAALGALGRDRSGRRGSGCRGSTSPARPAATRPAASGFWNAASSSSSVGWATVTFRTPRRTSPSRVWRHPGSPTAAFQASSSSFSARSRP